MHQVSQFSANAIVEKKTFVPVLAVRHFSNFFSAPRYVCFYSEKRQIHSYSPFFFPITWPLKKGGGDRYWNTFFFSLDRDFLMQVKTSQQFFGPKKCRSPPQKACAKVATIGCGQLHIDEHWLKKWPETARDWLEWKILMSCLRH